MPSPSAAPRRSLTLGHGSTRRDLRAPSHQPGGRRSKVSGEPPARGRVAGVSPLPPLAPFGSVFSNREAYAGPTDESNWVVPGRVMAGAYPGYDDDGLNYKSLFRLLEAGVTCFVCLQLEYDPDAREDAWRRGDAIRPYFHDAAKIARDARRPLDFVHVGIEDCAVVDDAKLNDLAARLARRLLGDAGEALHRVALKSSTRLQCARNRTVWTRLFRSASRTRREQSIRPKISRIDVDLTELESSEVLLG